MSAQLHLKEQQEISLYISEFNNKLDNQPKQIQITLDQFIKRLTQPVIRPEKDGKAFAPATFNGTRAKENAQNISLLVLDYDNGATIEEIKNKCKNLGYSFTIYTTHSHTHEKHKFRVVFPLAIPIPANIYCLLWQWTVKSFPNIDLQAKDSSRLFYYPAIKTKNSPFYAESFDGKLLDWRELQLIEVTEQPRHQDIHNSTQYSYKANNAYVQAALDGEIAKVRNATVGERNGTLNKAAFALGQLLYTNLIDELTITGALETAGLATGLSRNEARDTIASGIKAGRKQPRIIPETDYSNSHKEKNIPIQNKAVKAEEKPSKPKTEVKSLKSLWNKTFSNIDFLVDGILPEGGVNLVVGKPKTGKSNLVTNLALALAYQGVFLNQQVAKANVLYLNLEDGERRLKQRVEAIIADNEQPPDNFDYISGVTGLDAIQAIDEWLARQQGKNLIVIDTLAKFRGMMPRGQNQYDYDYHSLQLLRELADKYPVTFLVIHHSRKAESEDVLDNVSGSLGLSGACDNIFVLKRARGVADSELHIVGRDLEDKQLALRYSFPYWTLLGTAQEYAITKERRIVLEILQKQGSLPLKAIVEAVQMAMPSSTYQAIKQLLYRMLQDGLLTSKDKGIYMLASSTQSNSCVTSVTDVTSVTSVTSVTDVGRTDNISNNTILTRVSNAGGNANAFSNADNNSSVTTAIVVNKEDMLVGNASNASNASNKDIRKVKEWLQQGLLNALPKVIELSDGAVRHTPAKAVRSVLTDLNSANPKLRAEAEKDLPGLVQDIDWYLSNQVI